MKIFTMILIIKLVFPNFGKQEKITEISKHRSNLLLYFQVFKVVVIFCLFICIFFGTILSKMTVLLAAVNVRTNTLLYCVQYNTTPPGVEVYAQCVTLPYVYNDSTNLTCLGPENGATDSLSRPGQDYRACDALAIRWIWSLTLIMLTPEIFVFIRSFWTMCFKKEKRPAKKLFFTVSCKFIHGYRS